MRLAARPSGHKRGCLGCSKGAVHTMRSLPRTTTASWQALRLLALLVHSCSQEVANAALCEKNHWTKTDPLRISPVFFVQRARRTSTKRVLSTSCIAQCIAERIERAFHLFACYTPTFELLVSHLRSNDSNCLGKHTHSKPQSSTEL